MEYDEYVWTKRAREIETFHILVVDYKNNDTISYRIQTGYLSNL